MIEHVIEFTINVKRLLCVNEEKGSDNSAFLQKDQLCYLKRAEKLTFIEQHAKFLPFFVNASRLGEK